MAWNAKALTEDWREWEEGNGHQKRFEYVLNSALWCDVVFLVGIEQRKIGAHKLILSIGSKVFEKLFKKYKDESSFEVPDLQPEEFKLLLTFLYTGESPINPQKCMSLLNAASKYGVTDLVRRCGNLLGQTLTEASAVNVFQQAIKYGDPRLEEKALKCICKNAVQIIESPAFLELRVEELSKILGRDDLELNSETQLFEAVVSWGRAECKRQKSPETPKYMRSVLEPVIHLIRFPQMDPSEFSLKVATAQILLTEEILSVLLYFNVEQECRGKIPPGVFNAKSRIYSPNPKPDQTSPTVKRLVRKDGSFTMDLTAKRTGGYTICKSESDSIRFKSSIPIWLTSIGMNSCATQLSSTFVTVQIQLRDVKKILATHIENVSGVQGRIGDSVYHVQFKLPVYLRKDEWYTASFNIVKGTFCTAVYSQFDKVSTSLDLSLPDGTGRVVKFEFQNDDNLKYTGQGFIPEIGFKV